MSWLNVVAAGMVCGPGLWLGCWRISLSPCVAFFEFEVEMTVDF